MKHPWYWYYCGREIWWCNFGLPFSDSLRWNIRWNFEFYKNCCKAVIFVISLFLLRPQKSEIWRNLSFKKKKNQKSFWRFSLYQSKVLLSSHFHFYMIFQAPLTLKIPQNSIKTSEIYSLQNPFVFHAPLSQNSSFPNTNLQK